MDTKTIERDIERLKDIIKSATNKIEELKVQLEKAKIKEKETKNMIPISNFYYFIDSNGVICHYINEGDITDKTITENNYVYRTKSEAREWQIAFQMRRKLYDLCNQYPADWNEFTDKFHLALEDNKVKIFCNRTQRMEGTIYCENSNLLKNFIQQEGREKIIKYIFGIGLPPRYKLELK